MASQTPPSAVESDPQTRRIYEEITEVLRPMCSGSFVPESRIYHDLELAGEDVFEVLVFLNEKYKVDFSRFKFDQYFPNEIWTLEDYKKCVKGFFAGCSQWTPVTVADLVHAAKSGVWDV